METHTISGGVAPEWGGGGGGDTVMYLLGHPKIVVLLVFKALCSVPFYE